MKNYMSMHKHPTLYPFSLRLGHARAVLSIPYRGRVERFRKYGRCVSGHGPLLQLPIFVTPRMKTPPRGVFTFVPSRRFATSKGGNVITADRNRRYIFVLFTMTGGGTPPLQCIYTSPRHLRNRYRGRFVNRPYDGRRNGVASFYGTERAVIAPRRIKKHPAGCFFLLKKNIHDARALIAADLIDHVVGAMLV